MAEYEGLRRSGVAGPLRFKVLARIQNKETIIIMASPLARPFQLTHHGVRIEAVSRFQHRFSLFVSLRAVNVVLRQIMDVESITEGLMQSGMLLDRT